MSSSSSSTSNSGGGGASGNSSSGSGSGDNGTNTGSWNDSFTGLVYDAYCMKHAANYAHVECPDRIAVPFRHLSEVDLLRQCVLIPTRNATDAELLLTHPKDHIDYISSFTHRVYKDVPEIDSEADSEDSEIVVDVRGNVQKQRKMYGDSAQIDGDTYANQYSETCARKAIGGLIDLGETILKNSYNIQEIVYEEEQSQPTAVQEEATKTESIPDQVESVIETIKTKLEISEGKEATTINAEAASTSTADATPSTAKVDASVQATSESSSRSKIVNGFALIRPPGHHASMCTASGFCLYNNVACAINVWRNRGLIKRAMIVDFDVHHGNGTQDLFETDPDILYLSIHRYDYGEFYPRTGTALKIGEGKGKGYTINIPLNNPKMGDDEYLIAFKHIVMPIAVEFQPEIIVVSAGFDCALGDPLGGMEVTPDGFADITRLLMNVPMKKSKVVNPDSPTNKDQKIPIVFALEGGYNLSQISLSIAACIRTLLGISLPAPIEDAPPSAVWLEKCRQRRLLLLRDLEEVIGLHSKKWNISLPKDLQAELDDWKSKETKK